MNNKVAQRITEAREAVEMTKSELARAIDVKPATITQWESGQTKSYDANNIRKAARALKVSEQWLLTGHEQSDLHLAAREQARDYNTAPGPDLSGLVPLISWVQAGTWNPAESPWANSEIESVPCLAKHSQGSYALRVEGDSMTAPFGISYPHGAIIFVDPELRSPHNGQHIIAKMVGEDEVTFKVFAKDGTRIWLKPLNPQHPSIFDEFRVLGTVIGKWEDSP